MNLRPRLTYANVAATVALFLAVGGGTVYAAFHLGKNKVHSKNIAPKAVKASDIAKNAVTSPKIRDGSVQAADLAAGVIAGDIADVTGSATGGPQGSLNTNTTSPLPLTGTTTFTPQSGRVSALAAQAQFSVAVTNTVQFCSPSVFLLLNGQPTRVFLSPEDVNSTTLVTQLANDADGPFGLINPGTPL
ncbi:MAG TPA: hypothetical protein VGF09_00005, partial [Solirubrobacterales bacterium]